MAEALDYLTYEDLLEIAEGVLGEVLVRDHGLLQSAAARPQTSVFGEDAYPDFATKVAALMHSLARNHPLVDGNKRLAWSAMRVFCLMNGWDVQLTVNAAERLVLDVAAGATDVPAITVLLREHLVRH